MHSSAQIIHSNQQTHDPYQPKCVVKRLFEHRLMENFINHHVENAFWAGDENYWRTRSFPYECHKPKTPDLDHDLYNVKRTDKRAVLYVDDIYGSWDLLVFQGTLTVQRINLKCNIDYLAYVNSDRSVDAEIKQILSPDAFRFVIHEFLVMLGLRS